MDFESIESSRPERAPRADVPTLLGSLQERMRGLSICLSRTWGSREKTAAGDISDLAERGLKMEVLCLEGSPLHEHLTHRENIKVIPIGFRPREYFDLKLKGELKRILAGGVNLIHTHHASLLGSIAPWIWTRPNIALIAGRHIPNLRIRRDFLHQAMYRRLDALVVTNHMLKQNALQTEPLRERQVRVINLGLDFETFDPGRISPNRQRAEWGADENTIVIGTVGRVDSQRGHATLVKAAASLISSLELERGGADGSKPALQVKFVLVGEETLDQAAEHLEELQKMVRQFRIEESVIFAGYPENLPEVMRSFDIFALPSRSESFGLGAIEAMAMGCPVVIASGGGGEEIVGDSHGLLVRADDAFDLFRQLRVLIERPELRLQMAKKARQHAMERYDRSHRFHRILELYDRSLRKRSFF